MNPEITNQTSPENNQPSEYENIGNEIPFAGEQPKTFDAARLDGEVPEGVRDEKDYQEYLFEQKSRMDEAVNYEKSCFAEIEKMEESPDKHLLVAAIGAFQSSDKSTSQLETFITPLTDYLKSERNLSLRDYILERRHEARSNGSKEVDKAYLGVDLSALDAGMSVEQILEFEKAEKDIDIPSKTPEEQSAEKHLKAESGIIYARYNQTQAELCRYTHNNDGEITENTSALAAASLAKDILYGDTKPGFDDSSKWIESAQPSLSAVERHSIQMASALKACGLIGEMGVYGTNDDRQYAKYLDMASAYPLVAPIYASVFDKATKRRKAYETYQTYLESGKTILANSHPPIINEQENS